MSEEKQSEFVSTPFPALRFDDVFGLEMAKELLKENVILPCKFPTLWKKKNRSFCDSTIWIPKQACLNIMIAGCPGTGKTMLCSALAGELTDQVYYMRVRCDEYSTLAPWTPGNLIDDIVPTVKKAAQEYRPVLMVLEDCDSVLLSSEKIKEEGSESDHTTTMMTEHWITAINTSLQKLTMSEVTFPIIIIFLTSVPQSIHMDLINTLDLFHILPLPMNPDELAGYLFCECSKKSPGFPFTLDDLKQLVTKTADGFSYSDMSSVVNDASMEPLRRLMKAEWFVRSVIHEGWMEDESGVMREKQSIEWRVAHSPTEDGAIKMGAGDIPRDELQYLNFDSGIKIDDLARTIRRSRPSIASDDSKNLMDFILQNPGLPSHIRNPKITAPIVQSFLRHCQIEMPSDLLPLLIQWV